MDLLFVLTHLAKLPMVTMEFDAAAWDADGMRDPERWQSFEYEFFIGLIETINNRVPGGIRRFPHLFAITAPLASEDLILCWPDDDIEEALATINTAEQELLKVPTWLFTGCEIGEEGYAEIFFRQSPAGRHTEWEEKSKRSYYAGQFKTLRRFTERARDESCGIAMVRRGPRLRYMWSRD